MECFVHGTRVNCADFRASAPAEPVRPRRGPGYARAVTTGGEGSGKDGVGGPVRYTFSHILPRMGYPPDEAVPTVGTGKREPERYNYGARVRTARRARRRLRETRTLGGVGGETGPEVRTPRTEPSAKTSRAAGSRWRTGARVGAEGYPSRTK